VKLPEGPLDGALPRADVLRRLERRGVKIQEIGGSLFHLENEKDVRVMRLAQAVPRDVIGTLTRAFGLHPLALNFDYLEGEH
jgi:hypothetical protein